MHQVFDAMNVGTGNEDSSFKIWEVITQKFSEIGDIVENDNVNNATLGKILEILDRLENLPHWTVDRNSEQYSSVDAYTWLFGQLINIRLRENLKPLHEKCLQVQITLLERVHVNNSILYQSVLTRYICLLKEVCDTLALGQTEMEQRLFVFSWSSRQFMGRPEIELKGLNGCSQLGECVNFLITLFDALNQELSVSFYTEILCLLWKHALGLLRLTRIHSQLSKIRAYRFVTYLLRDGKCSHLPEFDDMLIVLLEHIMLDVSIVCQKGELSHYEDFCALLNALVEKITSNCFDYSLPEIMYFLLLQRTKQIPAALEDALFKLFSKVFQLCGRISVGNFLKSDVWSFDNVKIMMVVLHYLLKDNVRRRCSRRPGTNPAFKDVLNLYQENEHWRRLLDLVSDSLTKEVDRAEKGCVVPNCINAFKNLFAVSQLAVRVAEESRTENIQIIFFGEKITAIVNALFKLFGADSAKSTLLYLLKFARDVSSLNEAANYEEKIRRQLLALFCSAWLTRTSAGNALPETICEKYSSNVDEEVREFCVVSLMPIVHRYEFAEWRDQFFREIVVNRSARKLEMLPILVHSLSDTDLTALFDCMYQHDADCEILYHLSAHVRALVCGADSERSRVFKSDGTYRVSCSLCENETVRKSTTSVPKSSRRSTLEELIVRMLGVSEQAQYIVLSATPFLFRHLPKTLRLVSALQKGFDSSNEDVYKKMVEITPHLIYCPGDIDENLFLSSSSSKFSLPTFKNFMHYLREAAFRALINRKVEIQYACVNTIVQISCHPLSTESTLLPCVDLLLHFLLNASSVHASLANSAMRQIVIHSGFVADDFEIYMKYREDVCRRVASILVFNLRTYGVAFTGSNCAYASVFNHATISHILQYLLPDIAKDERLASLLPELASRCAKTVSKMLEDAFKYIISYVMLFESKETVVKVTELVCYRTNIPIYDLLSKYLTRVIAQMFMYFEEKANKVKWALKEIILVRDSKTEELMSTSAVPVLDSAVEPFLESQFLGVLIRLEKQLSLDKFCRRARERTLFALKSLIRFMSSAYITSVRFKLLLTLRTVTNLEKENAPVHCIDIWDAFVQQLDPEVLGPILSTIFVCLLPFAERHADRVNKICRYLVVEKQKLVGAKHIQQLHFLPRDHCDAEVRSVVEETRKALEKKPLGKRLDMLLKACKHEVEEVKMYALRHLKRELAVNRADISRLTLASDSVNRLVFRILDVLVDGFRNPDANVRLASGECLGEFGAIDPSYIPNVVINENDSKKYDCHELDAVEFVKQAFTLLCSGLQTTGNSENVSYFALAIQELIKLYQIDFREENKYWHELPEQLREIIRPLQSTKYIIEKEKDTSSQVSHLVFGAAQHSSVQNWAFGWSTFLISLLPENLTVGKKDLKVRQIFASCKMPLSRDIKCMMLFLPRLLLYAVLHAEDENLVKMYEEMRCVIKHDPSEASSPTLNDEKTCTQVIISEEVSAVISSTNREMGVICPKIVFNLLDVLHKKARDLRMEKNERARSDRSRLNKFLELFSKSQLAQKAFDRKEYMRSLLYLEQFLHEKESGPLEGDERSLSLLVNVYFHLNDVDNVKGMFATHTLKLHQLHNVIKLHEITDQFQDAAICYQHLLKTVPEDEERALFYEKRAIQCYLAINQPELALRFVNSSSSASARQPFCDVECEALWNLSHFDKLDKLTARRDARNDENWGVRIGQSLVYLLKGQQRSLEGEIQRIRTTLTKLLHMSTATMGGYRESYDLVVKLHILTEFEKIADLLFCITNEQPAAARGHWKKRFDLVIRQDLDERLRKLQPTNRVLQQVLNVRQAMFTVASKRLLDCREEAFVEMFNDEIRRCWLKVIAMANRTRNFELAYSNIIAIDNYQLKGFFIEKAKYYWEKTEQQEALRTLQRGLELHYSEREASPGQPNYTDEDCRIRAEAFILLGTYNDTIANIDSSVNKENFEAAARIYSRSEKTLFKLAQYLEKVIAADKLAHPETCAQIMRHYGESLTYGCEFIYHSLSTMLNVWLDLAEHKNKLARKAAQRSSSDDQLTKVRDHVKSMTNDLSKLVHRLPEYYLLTAFPLIVSRLTHPESACFELLRDIVIRCVLAYPNQSLWQLMAVCMPPVSSDSAKLLSERVKSKLLTHEKLKACQPMIQKFFKLFHEFGDLCGASRKLGVKPGSTNVTSLVSPRSTILVANEYAEILIPAQKFMTITLPRSSASDNAAAATATAAGNSNQHNPFPEASVNIFSVREEAYVYTSLQRPVRLVLVGTNGLHYPMIFKTDDLRIDSRAMEFNAVVNMYLKRDAEARNRALRIRTYSTLPLSSVNGMIEFIPNLEAMRVICSNMRRYLGLPNASEKDRRLESLKSVEEKRKQFRSLCATYKPVLHEWYAIEFPNPSSWYAARTAYVRSLAVMSVVGYVLGLGDRHNDNILLDRTNGEIVHVDFNSLFNKGETMPCPERVPFRLTHSMVKAMGPLGYEGSFRYTCEITNRIIRAHKDQLCSVLNTFLYDPSDFTNQMRGKRASSAVVAEKMAEKLRDVEACTRGVVRVFERPPSMPLSIEGQISRLIEEATNEDNLCQMFSGWASFM